MKMFVPDKLEPEVIPSPGTENKDWTTIKSKIELIKPFTKSVHIDIVDGKFAPNTTFLAPDSYKEYTNDLFFEVHLMVEDPLQYIKPFADAGFKRFIGQIEKMPDIAEFVAEVQLVGEVGLALDRQTSVDAVAISYEDIDVILIMTIQAGISGQKFLPELLDKVRRVREKSQFLPIEVDGGIRKENILQANEAGATRFVTTTAIFGSQDPREEYSFLTAMLSGSR